MYDGTTTAVIGTNNLTLPAKVTGDVVTLTAVAAFDTRNTGTGKIVSLSGSALAGSDATNYSLSFTGAPTASADITVKPLTISGSFTANNKVYDGTTTAVIGTNNLTLPAKVTGDVVTLTAVAAFDTRNTGTGKTVSLTGSALAGSDATNYSLSFTGAPAASADITVKPLTISGSFTANNKVYDGTTTAVIGTNSLTLPAKVTGDVVTLTAVAAFDTRNTGTGKTVSLTGSALAGSDATNYSLSFTGAPTASADITVKPLTISGSFTANNKVYDGTTTAVIGTNNLTLPAKVTGDVVTLTAVAAFDTRNTGTGKIVSLTGSALAGSDATNYSLSFTGAPTASADITVKPLTISGSFTANNKVYDGTTTAVIGTNNLTLPAKVTGDVVTLTAVAAFDTRNTGTGKIVSLTGSALAGSDATNYSLSFTGAPTAVASITSSGITITGITASDKVYDGTDIATLNTNSAAIVGIIGSDEVSLNTESASGAFESKNAGIGKIVTVSGLTLSGLDAGNYLIINPSLNADINPAILTILGVETFSREYNGTTSALLNSTGATLAGVFAGDLVTLNSSGASGVFASKNAGTGIPVSTTGFTLNGIDASNYSVIQPVTDGTITPSVLTIAGVTANNKVYDGTTAASFNTGSAALVGVFGSDDVSVISSGAAGTFADKNTGSGIIVSATGFNIGGTDAPNYTLSQPQLTADITPRLLTVTANDLSKPFRTTYVFSGSEFSTTGLVTGDVISGITINSSGASSSADAGDYIISISGGVNSNYTFSYVNGTMTVIKSTITATADNKSKVYGSVNPVLSITYSGFVNNEDASVLDVLPVATTNAGSSSDAGTYAITLSGGSDNNYNMSLVDGSLEITKAALSVTADNKSKVYGEANPSLSITYSGFVLGQDKSVLDVPPVAATSATMSSDAGNYDINASGGSDGNYSFTYFKGILTINKADQLITFENIPSGLRMTQEHQLNATAASGLPVSFESSDPSLGSIEGNMLTILKDGSLTITATQAGDHNWNPATSVAQTIDALPSFDNIMSLFTPNNDGVNDYWYIPGLEQYGKVQVTIYNRFGQTVYHSDGYKNDWDGTWNGYPLPSASYYYIIKSSLKGFIKGVVNIIR